MCSFPEPDAIDRATSRPFIFGLSFVVSSFFSFTSGLFGSYSIKSNGIPWSLKSAA